LIHVIFAKDVLVDAGNAVSLTQIFSQLATKILWLIEMEVA